jgi:feruloyl esterase
MMMKSLATVAVVILVALTDASPARAQSGSAASCASLAEPQRPHTTIRAAQAVTAGSFTPPGSTNAIGNLPPFCRVAGTIAPTSDSQISFVPLADQLRRGYAAASTNTGHEGAGGLNAARFAYDKPEQLIDFAYRAHHETALAAKALIAAFYGKAPGRSYFIGCSSGGYEGLMEAQRFPTDYDGILAGMPANNWTRLMAGDFDATLAVFKGGVNNLPPPALGVLHRGVLAACDGKDGVVDGILEDPRQCAFDPATLACTAGQDAASCLTPPQIDAARRIYGGLRDPVTGTELYPGLAPGSEPFWPNRDPASPFPIPVSHYKWLVFADPNWDWTTFDFSDPADYAAHQKAEAKFAPILNATDPNLAAFRDRGGKVLQYHGWNDQLITPLNSINYYESVLTHFADGRARAETLQDVQRFHRLFLVPGMAHCGGGTGPNTFDAQRALEQWVEHGQAPDRIIATRAINGVIDRSRPLCPYPAVAVYRGAGDTNDAANFDCKVQTPGR